MASIVRPRILGFVALVVALTLLTLVVLAVGGGSTPSTADAAGKTKKINIKDYAFHNAKVTVKKGTTVVWTNRDEMLHSVTSSKKGGPNSARLKKGETYKWVAKTRGVFKYHCIPHPFMKATITVQ